MFRIIPNRCAKRHEIFLQTILASWQDRVKPIPEWCLMYAAIYNFKQCRAMLSDAKKMAKKSIHLPECEKCLIAFSRVLFDQEVVIVFNSSPTEEREEYVTIKQQPTLKKAFYSFLFGDTGKVKVLENHDGSRHFIKLRLKPMQFVMLGNQHKT